MENAPESTAPVVPDVFAAWAVCFANAQRLNEVSIDTFRRLAEARSLAGAEALSEHSAHLVALTGISGAGAALAGWPSLMQSALRRQARLQQCNLDIWASALQTTTALLTGDSGAAPGRAAGFDNSVTERITERRVTAMVINFPDRRAAAVHGTEVDIQQSARHRGRGAVARR